MLKRSAFVLLALAVLSLGLLPSGATAQTPPPETSSLLVKLVSGLSVEEQAAVVARNGGTETGAIAALRLHVVAVPTVDLAVVLAAYEADPQVQHVEENKVRRSEYLSNDEHAVSQWALPQIGWDLVFGSVVPTGTAKVAVLDSGINALHPDLAGHVVPGTSILDGGDGRTDANGHGTWVAGIVAANTDNAIGIAGVAFAGVQLMPVTVLDANGEGRDSDVIAGVLWAADHGADVILMAFSNPGFSPNLQDAIDYAWSRGAVLVAAVGNDGAGTPTFPAGDRGVIGVSGTDQADALLGYSNYGKAAFLAAPGESIATTDLNGDYVAVSGTSSSAAIVAGVAAFLKAVDPAATNGMIVGRMARTADPAGTQEQTGNGRVNLARALEDTGTDELQPAGADPVGDGGPFVGPYTAASVTSVTITSSPVTLTSLPANVTVTFNYVTSATGTTTGTADILGTVLSGSKSLTPGTGSDSIVVAVPTGTPNGTYNIKVTVTNSTGGGSNNKNDNQNGGVVINVPTSVATSLAVSSATGTYGGIVNLTATLTSGGSGVNGKSVAFTLNGASVGSATTNGSGVATLSNVSLSGINAGTYSPGVNSGVGASFAGDSGFQASNGSATLTVNKADATVVVAPYTVPYNGLPHTATVTSITGVNGETGATVGTVNVSNTTHTNAGTYNSDYWFFTGTANYKDIGNQTITDTINKADATVVVAPYTVPYNGLPHTATVTSITGVNGETGATVGTVDVSNTTHTNAGTYNSDYWFFTGTANYKDIGNQTITDTINKADATVVVAPYTVPYNGLPHTATVTSITGVNGETGATVGTVDVSNTTHTNAGTYNSDYWFFTGTANYKDIGNQTITDTINKADATVVVTPYTVPYNGLPHTASVTSITGVNGETGATVGTVDVSNTTHTNAGTYNSDYWFFTGTANYKDIGNQTITDTINKADATVVVAPYTVPYNGLPHTATVTSITGVNGETGATVGTVNVSNTTHTNAGTYNSDYWFFTGAANYKDIGNQTITDTINKADATVVVAPYTVPYNGLPHTATVTSITGVNGETGATVGTVNVSNTTHTNAGTYNSDYWFFTGAANYKDIGNQTITDTINKADATVVVAPYTVPYNGLPHTATVTSITGVNGETGATVGTVDVSNTTHTNAGTYNSDYWFFTGTANYKDIGNQTITDTINKADATVVVTPYTVTYDGLPHTASVTSITGVNGETGATVGTVDVSNTTHTNPGTYSSDTWSFTGTANYKDIGNQTITDTISYGVCSASVGAGGVVLPPINNDGTSVYSRKGGSTIPVKFRVCAADGTPISNAAAVFAPTGGSITLLSAVRGTIDSVNETGITDVPDVGFRWASGQWIFNMATSNLTAGTTYKFQINLAYGPASIIFWVGVK